ncbi:MAG TPA: hypothetical protein VN893_17250 [Bryobacteraceae bacterium]|nr:hypothetical protein [Bryobacteraceae bacterium]
MKPVLFLRAASVLSFLIAVGHTVGGVFGSVAPGVQAAAVLAMKTNQFQVMGVTRSYWDFYLGEGLAATITMLVGAVFFWQLGSLASKDAAPLRPILATFLVGHLCLALLSWRYFIAPPVVGNLLIAVCLALAILTSRRTATA